MGALLEPRPPAKGWLLRWPRQAMALSIRMLPQWIVLYVAQQLVARVLWGVISSMQVTWAMVIGYGIYFSAGTATLFIAVYFLAGADGRETSTGLRSPGLWKTFLGMSIAAMTLLAFLNFSTPPPEEPVPGSVDIFADNLLAWALATSIIPGGFWVILKVVEGIRFRDYFNYLAADAWACAPDVMLLSVVGILAGMMMTVVLPPWMLPHVCFLLVAWLYVGAREVFGHVAENGPAPGFSRFLWQHKAL